MRIGRIILLASLAQILGLPALVAALSEHPVLTADAEAPAEHPVWKALFSVPATDVTITTASSERPSSVSLLAVTALSYTPLRHAIWMVAPAIRTVAVPRPRQFSLLRC